MAAKINGPFRMGAALSSIEVERFKLSWRGWVLGRGGIAYVLGDVRVLGGARWGVVLGGRAVEGERVGADDTIDKRAVLEDGATAVAEGRALDDRVAVFVITVVVVAGIKFR
jgi:hypothetical protein